MLFDKNGNQYAVDKVEKNELEKNRVYSIYSLNIEKTDLPKGETVFQKVSIDGEELELGNIVVDIVEARYKSDRDKFTLGWHPFASDNLYSFSAESDVDNVSVLNASYDLDGDGKYTIVKLNQSLKKGKEEEISFEVDELTQGYCSIRPIINVNEEGNKHNILPLCETTSFYVLSKEEILEYIERKK